MQGKAGGLGARQQESVKSVFSAMVTLTAGPPIAAGLSVSAVWCSYLFQVLGAGQAGQSPFSVTRCMDAFWEVKVNDGQLGLALSY